MPVEKGRSTSEQVPPRSIAESILAAVLEAEFQRMKKELDKSRQETSRVARGYERTQEKLARERNTSVARANERGQAVRMATVAVGYAAGATQQIEELERVSSTPVTQAQCLKDHARLVERCIDEIDSKRNSMSFRSPGLGRFLCP